MKKPIILLALLCAIVYCQAQRVTGIVTGDATKLKDAINGGKVEDCLTILRYYVSGENMPIVLRQDTSAFITRISDNKFLQRALQTNGMWGKIKKQVLLDSLGKPGRFGTAGKQATPQGGLSALFPAQTIADGLGIFIAERFKEELTVRYLENFRSKLTEEESIYHFSQLFPKTYDVLQTYANVFDYKALLTALKEAFKDDLDNASQNVIPFLEKNLGKNTPELNSLFLIYDEIANKIPQAENPLSALAEIVSNPYYDSIGNQSPQAYFKIVSTLANSLRNADGTFINLSNVTTFFKNFQEPLYAEVFWGLFLEKNRASLTATAINSTTSVYDSLNNKTAADLLGLVKPFTDIVAAVKQFNNSSNKDIADLVTRLRPNLESLFVHLKPFLDTATQAKIQAALGFTDHLVNIYLLSKEEKYGLVIVELLKTVDATGLKKKNPNLYDILNKYGTFIANVAQAKSGQDVKEALDIAALPVGSYKIKRNTLSEISLNAYPGLALGVEYRQDAPANVASSTAVVAFTAPIGLGFNWGNRKDAVRDTVEINAIKTSNRNEYLTYKKGTVRRSRVVTGASHSLFISMIDIGAVTAFRINDDATEKLPEFTWENILAPGVFYVYGIKNSPLSIGGGLQYGPQLRKITATNAEISESMFSARIFLSVDVPLFSFFSRTEIKKTKQEKIRKDTSMKDVLFK